ncbi:MAG TPA: histidine kinase [Longimicrobium sp.]|nr:histidine kinase [Longimicrobium sp.]
MNLLDSSADINGDRSARLSRGELLVIFGFWTFMAVLTAANRLLDPRGPPGLQPAVPSAPVWLAIGEAYLWAFITPLLFRVSARFRLERPRWLGSALALLASAVVIAFFVDQAMDLLRGQLLGNPPWRRAAFDPLRSITRLWFINELIVTCAILAAGFARDYSLRYRARQEEAVHLQAETARLQAQLAEARLVALRTQLNPHFLFNTLHAVSALVERDPRGVRRMIARLSELLRHSLDASEPEVPLEREMEFVQRYLEIMQIRFQGRVEVRTEVGPGAMDALVPTLILQPLVENAIKHGVSRLTEGGRIEVVARRDDGRLLVCVRDDGPPVEAVPSTEGVGLRITRERLEQLYGDDAWLALRPGEGGGMEAEIALPYHTAADLRAAGVVEE